MNTRRYPRTLHEAFPFGPEYGCAIERPIDRSDLVVLVACAAAGVTLLALAALEWLA